jgi:hypothetical protein
MRSHDLIYFLTRLVSKTIIFSDSVVNFYYRSMAGDRNIVNSDLTYLYFWMVQKSLDQ